MSASTERGIDLERCAKRLLRAAELHEGSVMATKSALWEVQAVRRILSEVEGSLNLRLRAIDPEYKRHAAAHR